MKSEVEIEIEVGNDDIEKASPKKAHQKKSKNKTNKK